MNQEEFIAAALQRPSDWGYAGDLDLSHWGRAGFSIHRDSDLVDESNWAAILEMVSSNDSFEVESSRHWAVGWTEELFIDTKDLAAVDLVLDMFKRLEDYPLLNDEDHSSREWEDWLEQYDNWGRMDLFGEIGYPEEDEEEDRIDTIMLEVWKDHGPGYNFEDILQAVREAV